MFLVKVFPAVDPIHASKIFCGLYDLEAQHKAHVEIMHKLPAVMASETDFTKFNLYIEAKDLESGKTCRICFDLEDSCKLNAPKRLARCDLYFKRSYDPAEIARFDRKVRNKVLPFGLNYSCTSPNDRNAFRRLCIYHLSNNYCARDRSWSRQSTALAKAFFRTFLWQRNSLPLLVTQFEKGPDAPAEKKVLFQTRLWEHEAVQGSNRREVEKINENRANTIRALKSAFGDRFVGGLSRDGLSEKYYPDCVSEQHCKQESYLELVKRCLVTVTSTGLHNSIGWKLPEFLASSRCIVTEKPVSVLPTPLDEYKNYLSFNSPESCVSACKRLLEDDRLATQMRRNNHRYYLNGVAPSVHVYKCLTRAFEHCGRL